MSLLKLWLGLVGSLLATLLAVACAGQSAMPTPSPIAQALPMSVIIASSDLAVGQNRFAFALVDSQQSRLVENAQVEVTFLKFQGDTGVVKETHRPTYYAITIETPHQHPDGTLHIHQEARGVYVVSSVNLDSPGLWGVLVRQPGMPEDQALAAGSFQVSQASSTPALGATVPGSHNKTVSDVATLDEISTAEAPDLAFYRTSIAQALEAHRPIVVVFSTPAFCQTRLCGPVLEMVAKLAPSYADRVEFIHIEPYDLKPLREQGVFQSAQVSREWGLPSEPWVFVVDSQGRLSAKFDGIFGLEELQQAVEKVAGS